MQPRFFTAALVGVLLWFFLPTTGGGQRACWWPGIAPRSLSDPGGRDMARSDIERIRYRAALQDEGQF